MVTRPRTQQLRQHIIETTDDLLYQKGFNLMSFTDIADASGVPRGNIYYYFRTKDEVLEAVIAHRLENMRRMLADWDTQLDTPLDRLKRYASIVLNESRRVTRYGCPMGSLNSELGKTQPELKRMARAQFDLFRQWLKKQFVLLQPEADADALAMHLLVATQGIGLMANVYADRKLIARELDRVNGWLDRLASSPNASPHP